MPKLPTAATRTPAARADHSADVVPALNKDGKTPAQRYYGRCIRAASTINALHGELKRMLETEPADSKSRPYLKAIVDGLFAGHDKVNSMLSNYETLERLKWSPSKASKAPPPGTEVALKDWVIDRMTKNGAFKKEDCAKVKVVSVHGDQLKVSTLKGEVLGLISIGWVDRSAKAAAA